MESDAVGPINIDQPCYAAVHLSSTNKRAERIEVRIIYRDGPATEVVIARDLYELSVNFGTTIASFKLTRAVPSAAGTGAANTDSAIEARAKRMRNCIAKASTGSRNSRLGCGS